ncbi:kinetochore Spc7 family protein [Thalassoroseus pseudoceratinae]|uniref:hypothetical protein n=1 Tax=Thalassoroseus pseudoceratinae TaxID=2713176 RepID=UPI00141DF49A|nr:hypothetical protein [Thalassoroseus pseudoceratinae]
MHFRAIRNWSLTLLTLAITFGCNNGSTPSEELLESDTSENGSVESEIPSQALLSEDRSRTTAEYIDAGMPSPERTWTGNDLARAANVLSSIYQTNPQALPKFQNDKSGEVFAKLVSAENLEFHHNASLPLPQRINDAFALLQAIGQITKLYLTAHNQGYVEGSEFVEFAGFQLRTVVVISELVDEFVPTLDANDPDYGVRMQGLEQMRSGLATVVAGSLLSLTETSVYAVEDRRRMIDYLSETLPEILPRLSSANRQETLVRLKELANDPSLQDLKPELTALQSKLK